MISMIRLLYPFESPNKVVVSPKRGGELGYMLILIVNLYFFYLLRFVG